MSNVPGTSLKHCKISWMIANAGISNAIAIRKGKLSRSHRASMISI
ncbi:MAG: hypothetical protein K2J28_03355 [Duncaniella sp.]|nr:hypothetical protein [Duncaniella sp.]